MAGAWSHGPSTRTLPAVSLCSKLSVNCFVSQPLPRPLLPGPWEVLDESICARVIGNSAIHGAARTSMQASII